MRWKAATDLLAECEQQLRTLVTDALSTGDYADVLRITDLAKAVAALGAEGRTTQGTLAPTTRGPVKDAAMGNGGGHPTAQRAPASRTSRREAYPKFFRRGGELVKVGWSKKDRKEYNHRAPRRSVDAVAAAVRQVGAKGKLFNGDALLPLKDPADGAELPDYQAYVALAWLKYLGVVEQHGRRSGYALVPGKQLDGTITSAWPELPEWRG